MSRSEYHNLRKTPYRERWVKAICADLEIEPDYNKAIDFALAATVSGLAVPNPDLKERILAEEDTALE